MSGRHPELIEAGIANLSEGRRRDCLRRVLKFLLDNQYVKSGALPERLWKVEEGSGMGLVHSGDLCDAALGSLAESWSTDPVVLREHGVRLYVRFRDDIFFIGSDRRLSVSYLQELRRRAKFFHIIADCPSNCEVQFLEVKVWKSVTTYHTVPCPKPTSLGIPLDVTSAHPPRVHLSWLVGTISRVQGLSTHREHAESAKTTLVNRFRRHLSWCGATSSVQNFLSRLGVATALDFAGCFDSVEDVRRSVPSNWLLVDTDSAVEAWRRARRCSRSEVAKRAQQINTRESLPSEACPQMVLAYSAAVHDTTLQQPSGHASSATFSAPLGPMETHCNLKTRVERIRD